MQQTNDSYEEKLQEIEKSLKDYLYTYDITNSKIALKFSHTFRTKNASQKIALALGLNGRDLFLSNIIALFHDYARFEQIKKFDTYNDHISVDHGNLGAQLLIEENQIENFVDDLTDEEKEIIRLAVKNHNKYCVEDGLTDRQKLFCNIIRDADKVDIFRIASSGSLPMNSNIEPLKEEDLESFRNKKLNKTSKEQTFYTSIFNHLCYIFDINFKPSFELINENNFIRDYKYFVLLWSDFKIEEELLDCFDEAIEYVKEKAEA